jgi:hypothetical protein
LSNGRWQWSNHVNVDVAETSTWLREFTGCHLDVTMDLALMSGLAGTAPL